MTRRSITAAIVITLTLLGGIFLGRASADQPQMQMAIESLRAAKEHLEHATVDKGGHREKALRLTNDAIAEVEAGIKFDRRH